MKTLNNNITILSVEETSYENSTYWITYKIGNKYSYEVVTGANEAEAKREFLKIDFKLLTDKPNINECSPETKEGVYECGFSENEMYFIDEPEAEELGAIIKDVEKLNLYKYIEASEEEVIFYGGIITKFVYNCL